MSIQFPLKPPSVVRGASARLPPSALPGEPSAVLRHMVQPERHLSTAGHAGTHPKPGLPLCEYQVGAQAPMS